MQKMSTENTGQGTILEEFFEGRRSREGDEMGVASPSTKRRLGAPDDVVAAKLAKLNGIKNINNNNEFILPNNNHHHINGHHQPPTPEDSIAVTTDFLTTSILARTLLTSTTVHGHELTSDPLESLKSTLEALPAPNESLMSPFLKSTISDADTDEFTSLLCREPSLTPVAVVNGLSSINPSTGADWSSTLSDDHQVITEDENGKSYFNLGSADATIVVRKSPTSSNSLWLNGSCGNSSSADMDDNASSSSCESLSSSEDLFNSGEEFDASDDDEEEFSSYKQQRSTVLHLSLCKLNKFRSQHCVEPSLHRSVLICNTLRHIEQEIKSEDEVDESLKSREQRLPSFWRPTSNHHPHCFSSSSNSNQPLISDSRPLAQLPSDPYLSPNPYSTANNPLTNTRDSVSNVSISNSNNSGQPPYLYDYSCLRPTPYHTTSYDYEQDLPSLDTSVNNSTLLECDSGYGEELSYYYSNSGTTTSSNNPVVIVSQSQTQSTQILCNTSSISSSSPVSATSSQQQQQQFLPFQPPLPSTNNNSSASQNHSITTATTNSNNGTGERVKVADKSEFESSETDSDSSSGSSPPPIPGESWSSPKDLVPQPPPSFAQQDSQCGMESRRSSHLNFSSHSMPLDNLISSSYASSL